MQGAPGQPDYQGTASNGISSSSYGKYGGSIRFPGAITTPISSGAKSCPGNATGRRGQIGTRLTCHCAPQKFGGTVWGSDIYTDDSVICQTVLHAGVISTAGGAVTLTIIQGLSGYAGSSRNEVKSSSYGPGMGVTGSVIDEIYQRTTKKQECE